MTEIKELILSDKKRVARLLEAQLLERELAKKNLFEYGKYMFSYYYKKPMKINWHHEYLSELLKAVRDGEINRLMINLPPNHSKSEFAVRLFASWVLGNDPSKKIIYASYGADLSTLISTETRDIVDNEIYKSLFPGTRLDNAQNSKDFWTTTKGGRFFATSTTATVTGVHADFFILDDPSKASEIYSEAKRKEVIRFYQDSVVTRLIDEDRSGIILIMQRLHQDDLSGYLMESQSELWTQVKLQSLNKEREIYEVGNFKYEREPNEPLYEASLNYNQLMRKKIEMGKSFEVQMQQNPEVSEAGFFEESSFTTITEFEIPEQNQYIFIDPAGSKSDSSDDRAIVVEGWSIDDRDMELVVCYDCDFGKWDMYEFCEHIISMMSIYPKADVLIESYGGGIFVEQALQREIAKRNAQLRAKGVPLLTNRVSSYPPSNKVSKEEKIMSMHPYYNLGQLRFRRSGRGMDQIKKELLAFDPEKKHNRDNCIDALSSGFALEGKKVVAKRVDSDGVKKSVVKKRVRSWGRL